MELDVREVVSSEGQRGRGRPENYTWKTDLENEM